MKIRTDLPDGVHKLTYVKNSHWIELEDVQGTKHKLYDNGLLLYECPACQFYCFTPHSHGDIACPLCKTTVMKQRWERLQVCFVPETESTFSMPQKPKK